MGKSPFIRFSFGRVVTVRDMDELLIEGDCSEPEYYQELDEKISKQARGPSFLLRLINCVD
jgi:hypothetical protein